MKKAILFAILLIPFIKVSAQNFLSWQYNDRYFSLTAGTGHTLYLGELNNKKGFQQGLSNLNLGVECRLLTRWAARAEFVYYNISGSDTYAEDSSFNKQRNLSFRSNNFEGQLGALYYFKPYNKIYHQRRKFEPYAHVAVGVTTVNPKAQLDGKWEALRPLATEGTTYKGTAIVIPFGVGVKARINEFINLVGEVGYRYAFTDRLDDVSENYGSGLSGKALTLSNRKDEIDMVNETAYEAMIPGAKRGETGNDSYLLLQWKLEFYLPTHLFKGGESWFSKPSAFH
jgi:hypothetical protein